MSATHSWKRKCRATATHMVTRSCDGQTRAIHMPQKSTDGTIILLWAFPKQNEPHESWGWLKPQWWWGVGSPLSHHRTVITCHIELCWWGDESLQLPTQFTHSLMLEVLGVNSSQDCVKEITESVAMQTQRALLVGCMQVQCWIFMHRAPSCMYHFKLWYLP